MNPYKWKQDERSTSLLLRVRFYVPPLIVLAILCLAPQTTAWLKHEAPTSAATSSAQRSETASDVQGILAPQVTVFTENFDGVAAPALPAGWSTQLITGQGGDPAWTTTAAIRDTVPNSVTTNDPNHTTDKVLTSPSIAIPAQPCLLTFRNNYNLENNFDGGVLEVSINSGVFQDVLSLGGAFLGGGYNGTLLDGPLVGRAAWTGNSGGFITTTIRLPGAVQGQNIRLRWRVASDDIIGSVGQFVDTVAINTVPIINVTNTNDSGAGSYRQALLTSNATPGYDAIHFNIPGSGVRTITPITPFPDITDPVLIDATTQPGYSGNPIVELDGVTVANAAAGVTVSGGRTTVRGFVINRFHTGINLNTGSDNSVENNYVGVDATGNVRIGNIFMGISISGGSNNNLIGGTTPARRNIISGNGTSGPGFEGIRVFNSSGNRIMGNYIGTNAAGTAAISNSGMGIALGFGGTPATASNNFIGGTEPGAGNVISGNAFNGVDIQDSTSSNNQVLGNFIGTNAAGTAAIGNGNTGVMIRGGSSHDIGGTAAGSRNVISGNGTVGLGFEGIRISNASNNSVRGNYIGTNAAGNAGVPNLGDGVLVGFGGAAPNNSIRSNVISANGFNGIKIEGSGSSGNVVDDNFIGTDASGTAALGNTFQGILIDSAPDNNIGFNSFEFAPIPLEATANESNVIAFNGAAGVNIRGAGAVNNSVEANAIFSNGALGIDLGDNGITLNDLGDGDTGPNSLQNYPVLTLASLTGGTLTITGTINSTANTDIVIEFFSSSNCDSSGNGEGATWLGARGVTTDASGNATINSTFSAPVTLGQLITATAAALDSGGTSEFSACRVITTPTVQFSSSSYSTAENLSPATITVTRTNGSAGAASVQYATVAGGTAVGGASCAAGVDFVNASGTLNWADGDATNKTFPITICNDATFEAGDTVILQLSNPVGTSLGSPSTATLTITNDDSQPSISITDVTQAEGNSGTTNFGFNVSLSNPSSQTITVQYATANGTATASNDYVGINATTLTFNPGVTSQPVNVTVNGDTLDENNETFFVNLSNPTNASISDNQGQGTITDDDAPPSISIVDVTQTESDSGSANFNFTVNLSAASGLTVTVNYVTSDNTANSGSDYQQTGPATLTFNPGETSKTITVPVNGDTLDEPNETFFVNLSTPVNASISDNQALGTINDDDAPPTISINDVSVAEGNSGTTNSNFTVSLSAASSFTVTVNYITADGSANSGSDYQQAGPATLTFTPGQTSRTLSVLVNGDTANEPNETFVVNLSSPTNATIGDAQGQGTITNDDAPPALSINDVSVNEGNAGTSNAVFLVTLSAAAGQTVTVNYASANGTAVAGSDYNSVSNTLTFNPGETSKNISVPVVGDTTGEPNETFFINLSNATNATIADDQGAGTILNDDQGTGNLKITGRVLDVAGVAIAGIAVNLSGDLSLTVNTDGSGNYEFSNLNAGGNFTVTPSSALYSFTPVNRTANPLTVDRIFNFVGRKAVVSIAGQVTDGNGSPLSNTSISLFTNGVQTNTTVSDGLGHYVFAGLQPGADYVVAPNGSFRPSSQTFNALTVEGTANFQTSPQIPTECGTASFVKSDMAVGSGPQGVVSADFNADGRSDLAVANFLSNTVSILLATGPGTFGPPTNFGAGVNPIAIEQGDFNSDGRPDVVVANFNSSTLSVLLATGPGTFGSPAPLTVGTRPRSIAVADFNNDGKVDLASANQSSNNVSVLLGNGTGGFGAATPFAVGVVPLFVAAADFNNDGFKDLVTADAGSNAVSLLVGTGGGSFSGGVGFPAGTSPFAIAVGDFNHDSRSDLAVANNDSSGGLTTISILLASPSGGFGSPAAVTVGTNPSFIAVADFNGDGHLDLSVANGGSNNVTILLGTGLGGFVLASNIPVGTAPRSLAVGDYNVDGKSDLVVGNFTSNNLSLLLNSSTLCNTQTSLTISGKTVDYNGNPIAGVTLTLSGPVSKVIHSDAGGNYSFNNLVPGGNYVVKAQSPYHVFAPSRADFFNLSGSHILNVKAAPFSVPAPLPPLDDDFSGSFRDPNKWTLGTLSLPASALDPAVTVLQRNGRLEITPLNQQAGLHYNGYVSANSIDIRGGPTSVELVRAASGGAETIFALGSDAGNFFRFMVRTANPASQSQPEMYRDPDGVERPLNTTSSQLLLQIMVDGQLATLSVPYDPIQHRHMRFRYEPPFITPQFGAVLFEASPDNSNWTVLHRSALTRVVNPMTVELSAGTSSPGTGESAIFDNIRRVLTTVQFSSATYQVNEGQQAIDITVLRTGDTTDPASVEYETIDGTASQLNRYTQASGTLNFATGVMNQSFRVLVNNNNIADGDQIVDLVLSNSSGSELISPARATLSIVDDDTVAPTTNPLDDPVFFVTQHYSDFLSRQPDQSGLNFWVEQITSCPTGNQDCVNARRIRVSHAFFFEQEFQQTGAFVFRLYRAAFGDQQPFPNPFPDNTNHPGEAEKIPNYSVFAADRAQVVGGAQLTSTQLQLANNFVQRPEFLTKYPANLDGPAFVMALLNTIQTAGANLSSQQQVLQSLHTQGGRGLVMFHIANDYWNNCHRLPGNPPAPCVPSGVGAAVDNRPFIDAEYRRVFVTTQYFGYLRRDADIGGLVFWLNQVNRFPLRDQNIQNAMVCSFITSTEYQQRFSPIVTHTNQECAQ